MTENEHLNQAFKILNQYEEYRFVKAWGIMMIVIGASTIIIGFLYQFLPVIRPGDPFTFMREITRATQLKLPWGVLGGEPVVKIIINLIMYSPIVLSFLIALYLHFTVKKTSLTDTKEIKSQKYAYFGLTLFLMSFLPFIAFTIFKVYYPIFSLIAIISSYISYLLLKRIQQSTDFREMLCFCCVLIIFTLPGVATSLIEIWMNNKWILWDLVSSFGTTPEILTKIYDFSQLIYFTVFSIGCIVTGYYSIQNGFKILKDGTRIHN